MVLRSLTLVHSAVPLLAHFSPQIFTPNGFDNNKGVIKICKLSSLVHRGGHALLTNLRKQIKVFAQRAEECAREAETAPNAVRDHYRQLEKYWLILAQHYLLTLEEAERSYGWAVHRSEPTQPSSVFENEKDERPPLAVSSAWRSSRKAGASLATQEFCGVAISATRQYSSRLVVHSSMVSSPGKVVLNRGGVDCGARTETAE